MSIQAINKVWKHSNQSGVRLLCLLALADYAHDDGTCAFPSVKTLQLKTRYKSPDGIKAVIRNLIKEGEIVRHIQPTVGSTNHYDIVYQDGSNVDEIKKRCQKYGTPLPTKGSFISQGVINITPPTNVTPPYGETLPPPITNVTPPYDETLPHKHYYTSKETLKETSLKEQPQISFEEENNNPDFNQSLGLKDFDQYNPYLKEITSKIRGKKNRPTNQSLKRRWLKILSDINPDGTYWQYLLAQAETYSFSFAEFLEKAENEDLYNYWLNGSAKEKTPPAPPVVKYHGNGNGHVNGKAKPFKCSDYYRELADRYELGVMVNGVWDTSPDHWWKDGQYTDLAWKYDDHRKPGEPDLPLFSNDFLEAYNG
jgi:hypothetical protein